MGIAIDGRRQLELLQEFQTYYDECPFREQATGSLRYYYSNPSFSYTDALTLYSLMRAFQPRRILEIGCGYSSCVMLDTSELFLNDEVEFIFVDPYPELLYSLMKPSDSRHTILRVKLQEV